MWVEKKWQVWMFATENESEGVARREWVGGSWPNKTRFQLILSVDSQNVTKNRTDHMMHLEGPQICQIKRWNNSFQNVYGMKRQQLTVWPGKSILCQKIPHFRLFWWTQIWVTWLWKDLDAKRLTPGQLLGWPGVHFSLDVLPSWATEDHVLTSAYVKILEPSQEMP